MRPLGVVLQVLRADAIHVPGAEYHESIQALLLSRSPALGWAEPLVGALAEGVKVRRSDGRQVVGDVGELPAEVIVSGAAEQIVVQAVVGDRGARAERPAIAGRSPLSKEVN